MEKRKLEHDATEYGRTPKMRLDDLGNLMVMQVDVFHPSVA